MAHALPRLLPGDLHVARVPMCLPKLRGVTISEGLLTDEVVITSMTEYHDIAAAWLAIQQKNSKTPAPVFSKERLQQVADNVVPIFPLARTIFRKPPRLMSPFWWVKCMLRISYVRPRLNVF